MNTQTNVVTLQLPAQVYAELELLQTSTLSDPVSIITQLIHDAHQQQTWQRNLAMLQEQIAASGGLRLATADDELVEQLRQTRQAIFMDEYAHLY